MKSRSSIPIINIASLVGRTQSQKEVAIQINKACREYGFFYIVGHGISEDLQQQLENLSQVFFNQPKAVKMEIEMALAGKAWRGYFPVGDELTSGKPDRKEGIYFGTELDKNHPKVKAGIPMHGANLFPTNFPNFKAIVLEYMAALTELGQHLMRGLSLSLGLSENYFYENFTNDPLCLFRIFHYPTIQKKENAEPQWGVGEHTDYGVLTILKQDDTGGLQVKSKSGWIEAPVIPNSFVCNIGDMLDKMTNGLYRSTPHRVLNRSNHGRLSYPFFFDPNFDATIYALPITKDATTIENNVERWDGENVYNFQGTYGDYVLNKVSKVFPELKKAV